MTRMGFYHLTRTTPELALPELLGRTLAAGARAVVVCASEARVAVLDQALWAPSNPDWLPHGTARTGHAELQPIWIATTPEAPNGARYLFLLDGIDAPPPENLDSWDRIFDLFDGGSDDAVQAARRRWAAAKTAGCELTYWKQTETGWAKA